MLDAIARIRRRAQMFLDAGCWDRDRFKYDLTPYGRGRIYSILDVDCRTCQAPPGEPCMDSVGRSRRSSCAVRLATARKFWGVKCSNVEGMQARHMFQRRLLIRNPPTRRRPWVSST
jgi:hypothetical protein